jgi:hypothetical protein
MSEATDRVIADTRGWLERAVIGLNLCPFAKAVHVKGQVHYAVSAAMGAGELLQDLADELDALMATSAEVRETTLLMAPACMADFLEFTDLLSRAERMVRKKGLEGEIQLASFHPAYQFADSAPDDLANFSNRSPYPTLHLLRETSIDRAVEAIAQPEAIYEANKTTLRALGKDGWARLRVGPST